MVSAFVNDLEVFQVDCAGELLFNIRLYRHAPNP
jgi:hypothetical protein